MSLEWKFALGVSLIVAATAAGCVARVRGWLGEAVARPIMTSLAVAGYPLVGFLAIWAIRVRPQDLWLPVAGFAQAAAMAGLALLVGRVLFTDPQRRGLLGFSCGLGNHGITMAGFVVYLLAGEEGLGHNTVYAIYTFFSLVLVSYTIALHYSPKHDAMRLGTLIWRSLFNWRSIGMPILGVAILLSALDVPRPVFIVRWHVLDVVIYLLIAVAYFGIGLRLHKPDLGHYGRLLVAMLTIRHGVGVLIGLGMVAAIRLSPWPLDDLNELVVLIQASVPMGVLNVATANMFGVLPRGASTLMVISSALYLLLGVPLILGVLT